MQNLTKQIATKPARPERVLQFGEGNFLRAFIDWMIQRMNEEEVFDGSVVVVQPLENGLIEKLNEQDGLYTLYRRGLLEGEEVNDHDLIHSISRGMNPYHDWSGFMETAQNPDMRFVISNTTEAGITYVKTPQPTDRCPDSFPAKLTAWLSARYDCYEGDARSGIIFLPCELINHNGIKLKECILQHAADWALDEGFFQWVENDCIFLSTLVDRIVPGYPADEVPAMEMELGYSDQLICAAEIFHLLVIEGPDPVRKELPFEKAGLNVIWTEDMQPYRSRKVGVLNGAHTSSVLAAYLGGLNTVREMMNDPLFGAYVKQIVLMEIVPSLPMDREDAASYASEVMERFLNPFIHHELLSISLNSVSKWKVRVLPTLKFHLERFGYIPPLLGFSLAALIAFYKGDLRPGYVVCDDAAVVNLFKELWSGYELRDLVSEVLSNQEFWGEDLTELADLDEVVYTALQDILSEGMIQSVSKRIS